MIVREKKGSEGNVKIDNHAKADILSQAFPYIQKYLGKIIVIKYGGNAMQTPELVESVINDIVLLSQIGIKVVLVHGGGPDISETLEKMGMASHFINGLRQTDQETVKVVQMVLAGKNNKDLVNLIHKSGGKALGLCGIDGKMIQAEKLVSEADLGFVGDITGIETDAILGTLASGYIPVIATLGSDEQGNIYNINADTAAAYIAGALQAENLIMMTDVRGLLRDKDNADTLISAVSVSEVAQLMHEEIVTGGMIPKIESCVLAVREGVTKAFIIDGRIPHAILIEMMTDEGIGTMFY